MQYSGFDWDNANWPKCGKHGVSREEIEGMLESNPRIYPAKFGGEVRRIAFGRTSAGRYLFVVFALRHQGGKALVRPVSARYMHKEEIDRYENRKET